MNGQTGPELVIQSGHRAPVSALAFSPDGSVIATASQSDVDADGRIILWDVESGHVVRTIEGGVTSLVWTSGGREFAVGSRDGVRFHDAKSGRVVRAWKTSTPITAMGFGRDEKLIATAGGEIALRDATTGRAVRVFLSPAQVEEQKMMDFNPDEPDSITLSPDGKLLAASVGWKTFVWDVATGRQIAWGEEDGLVAGPVAFSPEGKWLAAGGALWEVATRTRSVLIQEPLATWEQSEPTGRVEFTPDGRFLLSCRMRDMDEIDALKQKANDANAEFDFSQAATVDVYDLTTGRKVRSIETPPEENPFSVAAIAPDGSRVVATGNDLNNEFPTLFAWNVTSGQLLHRLVGRKFGFNMAEFVNDNRLRTQSDDDRVRSWSLAPPKLLVSRPDSPTDRATTIGPYRLHVEKTRLEMRRAADNKLLWTNPHAYEQSYWLTASSPNAKQLVLREISRDYRGAGLEGKPLFRPAKTQLLDASTGKELRPLEAAEVPIQNARFTSDGALIGVSHNEVVRWNVATGKLLSRWKQTFDEELAWIISPDGDFLVGTSGDLNGPGVIEVWNLNTRRRLWRKVEHHGGIEAVLFTPDGRHLVTGGMDWTIKIWNLNDGAHRTILGHNAWINGLDLSSDGKVLVSAGNDFSVLFWEWKSGQLLATLFLPPSPANPRAVSDEWVFYTPEGYFTASPRARQQLRWNWNGRSWPVDKFAARFENPAVVQQALKGQSPPGPRTLPRATQAFSDSSSDTDFEAAADFK